MSLASRPARVTAVFAACIVVALATRAEAQEISISGPLRGGCILRRDGFCVPSLTEWSPWFTSGVSTQVLADGSRRVGPMAGAGAEITFGVARYVGFPAPAPRDSRAPPPDWWRGGAYGELRLGAWAQAQTRAGGGLVEGGVTVHLGTVNDSLRKLVYAEPYGVFDLRFGGGFAMFPDGRSPHLAVALGWGYRYAPGRHSVGLACDPRPDEAPIGDAVLGRLVTTVRRATRLEAWEVVVAIELSPTWATLPWRRTRERSP